MFDSAKEKLNFTCDYELKFRGDLSFGWNCAVPLNSYTKDLVKQLEIKSRDGLPTCDSLCEEVADRQLSYDDFEDMNITTLETYCQNQAKDPCNFNISVDFDFESQFWVRRDGSFINDLKWTSSDFPVLKNIVISHLYYNHDVRNVIVSTSLFPNLTGFYFCKEDQVISSNLKLGTYSEAKRKCHQFLTLDICNDRSLAVQLIDMATKVSDKSLRNAQVVHDFNFLSKPLTFWTGRRRLDQTRFVNENGIIITNPHCPINTVNLCDVDCSMGEEYFEMMEEEKSSGII